MTNKKKKGGKKKGKSGNLSAKKLRTDILTVFDQNTEEPLNYKQVSSALNINDKHDRKLVANQLDYLKNEELLKEVSRGKFKTNKRSAFVVGKVDMTKSGSAYVVTDNEDEKDIYIPPKFMYNALHKDIVKVFLMARKKRKGPEGQIVEIVKRHKMEFVGTIEASKKFSFLVPDDQKMPLDIYIPLDKLGGAEHGQKAVAKITDWPKNASSPFGEITQVLGTAFEPNTEMDSILHTYGFPEKFPGEVEKFAQKVPTEITNEEIKKRRDLRKVETFTIDPHDAKDFDDALSFEKLDNGNYRIGVHIADVTHYVKEGDIIDREAVDRATSVYLVDRTVPMLPEILSNKVCSLRPDEEKLTFSVIFDLDENGHVKNHEITRTVTKSDTRFTYEQAQEIIESGEGEHAEALTTLDAMAKQIRNRRMQDGAIAFDKVELRFQLDEEKQPVSVIFKVQKDAHRLIEEYMLLANRTVAEEIGKVTKENPKPKTFVYRIHDRPDPQKLEDFSIFVNKFGYKYKFSKEKDISKNMNSLLAEVQGKREEAMIETLAIRTMAKAEYSTNNIGHYGLSFKYYSHFTSPIRRYPDVMVHRLLESYLNGGKSADQDHYEQLCKHSSEKERSSTEAERDSTKFFQVLYMQDYVGEEFSGVISGVTEWGIYVEIIENKCEGMIRLRDIEGDYFYLDEKQHRIIGHNTSRSYRLGDEINIRVTKADLVNKRIDFELIS